MRSRWVSRKVIGVGLLALSGVAALAVVPSWADEHAPAPSDSDGAGRIVGAYWSAEDIGGELPISRITAEASQYNLMYAGFAYGHGTPTVEFYPSNFYQQQAPGDPAAQAARMRADLSSSQRTGTRWLVSVGGENGDVSLTSTADAAKLTLDLEAIVDQYTFQGVDFDLECKNECWTPEMLQLVAHNLKQRYGQQFLISGSLSPWLEGPQHQKYVAWAKLMGAELDLFGYQFYDAGLQDAKTLANTVRDRVTSALEFVAPCKILVGASMRENTIDAYVDAVAAGDAAIATYDAAHPTSAQAGQCSQRKLGGVFLWNANLDSAQGWAFAKRMDQAMRS